MATMTAYYIGFAVAAVCLIILMKCIQKKLGVLCECGTRMNSFDELTPNQQKEIVAYYDIHEGRRVSPRDIKVCPKCMTVQDDYVLYAESTRYGRTGFYCKNCERPGVAAMGGIIARRKLNDFAEAHLELLKDIECLRCKRDPFDDGDCYLCDTPVKVRACRNCKWLYLWMPIDGYHFKYLAIIPPGLDQTQNA